MIRTSFFDNYSAENMAAEIERVMASKCGNEQMWTLRAAGLVRAVLDILCYMRDVEGTRLDESVIHEHMTIEKASVLSRRKDLPDEVTARLRSYFRGLPGYNEADAIAGSFGDLCREQHGYLTLQTKGVYEVILASDFRERLRRRARMMVRYLIVACRSW